MKITYNFPSASRTGKIKATATVFLKKLLTISFQRALRQSCNLYLLETLGIIVFKVKNLLNKQLELVLNCPRGVKFHVVFFWKDITQLTNYILLAY